MNLEAFFLPPRTVTLTLLSGECQTNGYISYSEALLGIIPGSFANLMSLLLPSCLHDVLREFANSEMMLNGVFVCGLVPGSTAYSSGKIFLGDYLAFVNNAPTCLDMFESTVRLIDSSGCNTVQLTTQSLRIDKLAAVFGKSVISDYVIQFGENTHWNGLCDSLSLFPFAVFCCGGQNQEDSSEKAVYSHPLSDKRLKKALEGVIPCLIFLSDDYSKRSTMNSMQIRLENEHISIALSNSDPFGCIVLALPTRIADADLCYQALQIMLRVILFYFGTYERAFSANTTGTTEETDRIISVVLFEILCPELLFEELQMSADMSWSLFQTKFIELPHLPLPETVKVSVDSLLTDFEAADFSDPFLIPPRRRFVIMGSCLFYKGFLIASHLNTTDLIDIGLFLRHRFILSALSFSPQMASTLCGSLLGGPSAPELAFSPRAEQSVIWCEVFPTHRTKNMDADEEPCWPTFGYSEPAGARYVLLVVPKKQTFLAVLLEASGYSDYSGDELVPDSVIVREVSKLLNRLDGIGLLSFCEQGLASSLGVKLVSADVAFPSASVFMQSYMQQNKSGAALQTLAVTNVHRFSSALKGFLRSQRSRSMSFTSEQPQFNESEIDQNENRHEVVPLKKLNVFSKMTRWLTKRKLSRTSDKMSRASSNNDIGRDDSVDLSRPKDFDAMHYIESHGRTRERRGAQVEFAPAIARERAGVPGSHAGSGGTLSSSDGPGHNDGIPLPLANALPTLFDMSEAHLHAGDVSSAANSGANRGNISSPAAVQDVLFTCPGHAFAFIFFDRNQGFYVCPNDTYTPPGASLFHRRVVGTFLHSTIEIINMFDTEDDLEEAVFVFPTDPVEWFDYDPSIFDSTVTNRASKNRGDRCPSGTCSPKQSRQIPSVPEKTDSTATFDLNPVNERNQSYWCTLRKFPLFQEKEERGANSKSSHRMFALCGNESAINSTLDLGLQFGFDLTL